MARKRIFFLVIFCFLFLKGIGSTIDTLETYSVEMGKKVYSLVLLPDDYRAHPQKRYPVLYLLHGYSGNYLSWFQSVPKLQDYVDEFQMIIVTPDGGYDSWYMDSPMDKDRRYETFITTTLMGDVDQKYRTKPDRLFRGISGLSMGGHGALYLSIRHPSLYGAATSISGGVDLRPFPENWNLKKVLGSEKEHRENWENNSVINLVDKLKDENLALFIDIGVEDIFIGVNRQLHQKLLRFNIEHDYIERPGGHTWAYWRNALPYHLLFFRDYFKRNAID